MAADFSTSMTGLRAFAIGAILVDWLWTTAGRVFSAMFVVNSGPTGKALKELFRYLALEVSSGFSDGIGEAVAMRKAG